jgi:hypothetical protein
MRVIAEKEIANANQVVVIELVVNAFLLVADDGHVSNPQPFALTTDYSFFVLPGFQFLQLGSSLLRLQLQFVVRRLHILEDLTEAVVLGDQGADA